MNCKNCGNPLPEGVAFCPKCGTKAETDIAMAAGGAVVSQQLRITPINEDTVSAIGRLLDPLKRIAELNIEIAKLEERIKRYKRKKVNAPGYIIGGLCVGFIVVGYILGTIVQSITGSVAITDVVCVLCGIAGGLWGIMIVNGIKKKIRTAEAEIEEKIININDICQDINDEDIALLPPDYRFYNAAEFFYRAFTNQRALTMQQAVNLYEDEIRKDRMALIQQQQMVALQQQVSSLRSIQATSAVSATMNTLNFISKLF